MKDPRQYSAAETERMMKVQDVLLKAMARKITLWEAAEIIGVTDRTMRRWRERLEGEGDAGLADRRKGKPSRKRRIPDFRTLRRQCKAWARRINKAATKINWKLNRKAARKTFGYY